MFRKKHIRNLRRMEIWNDKDEDEKADYLRRKNELDQMGNQANFLLMFGMYMVLFGVVIKSATGFILVPVGLVIGLFSMWETIVELVNKKELEEDFFSE